MAKLKLKVNNKLRGALGMTTFGKKNKVEKVEINVKAHKGDKAELASTIKHELMHAKHPNKTEKEVYKKTAKTKIPLTEQQKLLKKLKMDINKDFEPGSLINKSKELSKTKMAIRGLV